MFSLTQIAKIEAACRAFCLHYFGIKRHLKQLFAPWRRLYLESSVQSGVSYWNAFSFNAVSRLIGIAMRLVVIIIGLSTIIINTVFWAGVVLIGWPIFILVDLIIQIKPRKLNTTPAPILINKCSINPVFDNVLVRSELSPQEKSAYWKNMEEFLRSSPAHVDCGNNKSALATMLSLISNQSFQNQSAELKLPWQTLIEAATWHWQTQTDQSTHSIFALLKRAKKIRPIGVNWAYGYTPNLDRFSRNLNEEAKDSPVNLNSRPELLRQITDTFSNKNSAGILLIGQPGIGKFSLCMSLAKHISQENTFLHLIDHRVMMLDLGQIAGIAADPATQALILDKIFAEASIAGNIILVIDNLHQFVSPLGLADYSHVFAKVNRAYRLKIIGLSTYDNFRQFITANPTVMTRFETVYMNPTNDKETLQVLQQTVVTLEKDQVLITLPALKEIVAKSTQILEHIPNPQKSINLLELCLTATASLPITKEIVGEVLTKKMGIPLGGITKDDKQKLVQLESLLSAKIVGQHQAIETLTAAVKRAQLSLETREKTKGAFLFLGPTGVGKTETVKALAEVFFGSSHKMIRIDLGEYGQPESLTNLIGSPQGSSSHSAGGLLTEAVRQQPYTTVLFDELEKAHPQILSALLTVLDEGYLTDARDQRISFRHTFVVATSNAGSELFFANNAGNQPASQTAIPIQSMIDYLVTNKIFTPEFLNRFDGIVIFAPLTPDQIEEIVHRKLKEIEAKIYQQHKLKLSVTPALLDQIIKTAYNPQFGARHLERVLTKEVLDRVADQLITSAPQAESTLTLDI